MERGVSEVVRLQTNGGKDVDADNDVIVIDDVEDNMDALSIVTDVTDDAKATDIGHNTDLGTEVDLGAGDFTEESGEHTDTVFTSSNELSDLRLIVEGRPLYVSRVVLSLVSPVMKRLLTSRRADDTVEVEVPDKTYGDFLQFLSCVYPNILAPVTAQNVEVVLHMADEYQVEHLMRKCELFLVADIAKRKPLPHPDKVVRYLNLSDKYALEELQRATFETAARTESDLLENVQDFWELPSVTTTSVFIRRLKLLEKLGKSIRSKFKEVQNHCSLYHKGDRPGNGVCTKCCANIGKYTLAELKLV